MLGSQRTRLALVIVIAAIICLGVVTPAQSLMLVSRADEVKIGQQVEQEVIKQYGGLSKDQAVVGRVQRVGKKVAAVSPRQDVTYTYKVLNSNVINAFAAPGGPVLITKRLATMLSTDDELAFVLAHETGHIVAQHGRKAINRALIAQGLASLLFRKAKDSLKIGMNIMYTLYSSGYSRDQEYQADFYGVDLMGKAKHDREGAVKALAKLGMKRAKGINKYLATHPDVPDRIGRVSEMSGISKERQEVLTKEAQAENEAQ